MDLNLKGSGVKLEFIDHSVWFEILMEHVVAHNEPRRVFKNSLSINLIVEFKMIQVVFPVVNLKYLTSFS